MGGDPRRRRRRRHDPSGAILIRVVDLADPRFGPREIHHELETLDREGGVYVEREHRTPERVLSWLDLHFGPTASIEAASGGVWLASDANGLLGFCAFDSRQEALAHAAAPPVRGAGVLGPLGVVPRARRRGIGGVLARAAAFALRERTYRYAVAKCPSAQAGEFLSRALGARDVAPSLPATNARRARTVVLASGSGSNFAAVAQGARDGSLPLDIVCAIANRRNAFVLERARALDIGADAIVWDKPAESRAAYDERLLAALEAIDPDLVLLLGWMHIVPAAFVERFTDALNLHPAYLPLDPAAESVTMPDGNPMPVFRGARAFADALASGSGWSGASVHALSVAVDRGTIFARAPFALDASASQAELETRLHALERDVVAAAVGRWHEAFARSGAT